MNVDVLTPKEAADFIRVSENTLRQWRWLGKGPPYIRTGRKILYARQDLEKWLMARRISPEGFDKCEEKGRETTSPRLRMEFPNDQNQKYNENKGKSRGQTQFG